MYPHLPLAFSVRQGFYHTPYGAERGFLFPIQNKTFGLFQSTQPFVFELRKDPAVPFQKREIRVIYKGGIFVQKPVAVNPQHICKRHRCTVLDGMPVILIQNQCRGHNAHLFRQFSCGKALECPVILQILARCGAFFIGFIVKGQMNHDFAFGIEVNPCVIEITIGKAYECIISAEDVINAFSDDHIKGQYYYL